MKSEGERKRHGLEAMNISNTSEFWKVG